MEKKGEKQLTFGRRLSAARLEKGIDLSTVSKEIRVGRDILQHIENSDHGNLPDYVFVKGFIRAYAEAIGQDKHEVLQLYQESYDHYQNALKAEADLAVYGTKFWRHLTGALALVGLVIFVSFMVVVGPENMKTAETPKMVDAVSEQVESVLPEEEQKDPAPTDEEISADEEKEVAAAIAEQEEVSAPDKLHLKIKAVEETWIKIIIDDETPRELVLKPGDIKEIKAEKQFNLLVGNAAGVDVEFNGKPLGVLGKSGQVTTLMLP